MLDTGHRRDAPDLRGRGRPAVTTANPFASLYRTTAAAMIAWTLVVAGSLAWNVYAEKQQSRQLATKEARAHFNKDKAVRLWAASHGGVYVPVSERTPPNPNLAGLNERDILTPSGRRLTLMNPAYMIRQLMNEYAALYGVKGKITSFPNKLFNKANMPDAWELASLLAFDRGEVETLEFTQTPDGPYLRLMRPMFIEEPCLKCHASQGYQVGDLRGAVGVAVPMQGYLRHEQQVIGVAALSHGAIWGLGLGAVVVVAWRSRRRLSERLAAEDRIRHMAQHDLLIHLPNRSLLLDRAEVLLSAARRRQTGIAFLFVDLDDFKPINDRFGHGDGDRVLREAARRIESCVRAMDTVARYGGDEFVVVLADLAEDRAAMAVADKILAALAAPYPLGEREVALSASIGLALYPHDGDGPEALIRAADNAMYAAKRDGKRTVRRATADG